jgi:hypothetical protein
VSDGGPIRKSRAPGFYTIVTVFVTV